MKSSLFVLMSIFLITGCHNVKRITEGASSSSPAAAHSAPEIITTRGITVSDHDIIPNIPLEDRYLTVKVKSPGMDTFRELNSYEMELNTDGKTVYFGDKVDQLGHLLVLTGKPVAPSGTEFIITSIASVRQSKSLY